LTLATLDQALADISKIFSSGIRNEQADEKITALLWDMQQKLTDVAIPTPENGFLYKDSPQKPVLEKGVLFGYAAVWNDANGLPFIDGYGDETVPNSWDDCIAIAKQEQQQTGNKYLMPHLFNHNKDSQIGAVEHLSQDSKGIVYQTKLALGNSVAKDVYELAKNGMLGTSYGFKPIVTEKGMHPVTRKPTNRLVKIHVRELSACVFPANPYTSAYAKQAPFQNGNISKLDRLLAGYERFKTLDSQASNLWADLAELAYRARER